MVSLAMASSSSSSSSFSSIAPRNRASSSLPLLLLVTILVALAQTIPSISASPLATSQLVKRANHPNFEPLPDAVDFFVPQARGGQMLTIIPGPTTVGLGEPVNIIVSGRSSRSVLTPVGFLLWVTSINFGISCLGQANGTLQQTNLGDGRGDRIQGTGDGTNGVMRFNYYSPYVGTCKETFNGGNHFRWWIQNGTLANSSAIFMAASRELPLSTHHMIDTNGYNLGRNELVGNATGATEWEGNKYNTTVTWIPAGILLNATSEGVNHPEVALPGQPVQDGMVAVLTVTQLEGSAANAALRGVTPGAGASLLVASAAAVVAMAVALQ